MGYQNQYLMLYRNMLSRLAVQLRTGGALLPHLGQAQVSVQLTANPMRRIASLPRIIPPSPECIEKALAQLENGGAVPPAGIDHAGLVVVLLAGLRAYASQQGGADLDQVRLVDRQGREETVPE